MITRHFVRKYTLPKDFDAEKLTSSLSSDGILTVKASLPKPQFENVKERITSGETKNGKKNGTEEKMNAPGNQ